MSSVNTSATNIHPRMRRARAEAECCHQYDSIFTLSFPCKTTDPPAWDCRHDLCPAFRWGIQHLACGGLSSSSPSSLLPFLPPPSSPSPPSSPRAPSGDQCTWRENVISRQDRTKWVIFNCPVYSTPLPHHCRTFSALWSMSAPHENNNNNIQKYLQSADSCYSSWWRIQALTHMRTARKKTMWPQEKKKRFQRGFERRLGFWRIRSGSLVEWTRNKKETRTKCTASGSRPAKSRGMRGRLKTMRRWVG